MSALLVRWHATSASIEFARVNQRDLFRLPQPSAFDLVAQCSHVSQSTALFDRFIRALPFAVRQEPCGTCRVVDRQWNLGRIENAQLDSVQANVNLPFASGDLHFASGQPAGIKKHSSLSSCRGHGSIVPDTPQISVTTVTNFVVQPRESLWLMRLRLRSSLTDAYPLPTSRTSPNALSVWHRSCRTGCGFPRHEMFTDVRPSKECSSRLSGTICSRPRAYWRWPASLGVPSLQRARRETHTPLRHRNRSSRCKRASPGSGAD